MINSSEDPRVRTVLNAFDIAFQQARLRCLRALVVDALHPAQRTYSGPAVDGLFDLVKALPATLRYENHIAAATGDSRFILHGRFSGHGSQPAAWVVADDRAHGGWR